MSILKLIKAHGKLSGRTGNRILVQTDSEPVPITFAPTLCWLSSHLGNSAGCQGRLGEQSWNGPCHRWARCVSGVRTYTHTGCMIKRSEKWPSKCEQSGPRLCLGEWKGHSWVGRWERTWEGMGGGDLFLLFLLCFLGSPPMETLTLQVYFQLGPRTLASGQQKLRGSACGAVHQPPG